jgi:hypothetical protein
MLKIGILGTNRKSVSTIEFINSCSFFELAGIYDPNPDMGKELAGKTGTVYHSNQFGLLNISDLLMVTASHENAYHLITECIVNTKHVIIDEPFYLSVKEIDHLVKLSTEASVAIIPYFYFQISNSFSALQHNLNKPIYVNIGYYREIDFNFSKTDLFESVLTVIDILTSLIRTTVRTIHLSTSKVFGVLPQLIHMHVEFDSGSSASVDLDFVSDTTDCKLQIYQIGQIISANESSRVVTLKSIKNNSPVGFEVVQMPLNSPTNPFDEINKMLTSFDTCQASLNPMENFRNKINLYRKVKDKLGLT